MPRMPDVAPAGDARLARLGRAAERGDSKETAREFETLFGSLLVRELRRSMPKGLCRNFNSPQMPVSACTSTWLMDQPATLPFR